MNKAIVLLFVVAAFAACFAEDVQKRDAVLYSNGVPLVTYKTFPYAYRHLAHDYYNYPLHPYRHYW